MTPQEHVEAIKDAIGAAEAAGLVVWIKNECCGCSKMSLVMSPDESFTTTTDIIPED